MQIKKAFLVVAFFGIFITAKAQNITQAKQDSLMALWNDLKQHDTIRLNAVHKIISESYRYKQPDSALYFAQLQYDLAKLTESKKSMVLALISQGDAYLLMGDTDKAFEFFNRGLKASEIIDDKQLKIKVLGNLTRVFQAKGEVEKSLKYSFQILKISEEIQDKEGIGKGLTNIGQIYAGKGDLALGLEHLNRAKKIFEEIDSLYSLARVRSIISSIYIQQGYQDEALLLLLENGAYFEKTRNKIGLAGVLANIGTIYSDQGDNQKALENFGKAMKSFEEMGNLQYVAGLSQNIGRIYQLEGNFERSLEYFNKGLKLSKEIKDKKSVASAKAAIGAIFATQGSYSEAISYGTEALTIYQETGDIYGIRNSSGNLVNSYKASGNYKKAFEMNKLHFEMRDSLNSKENQKALIELQVQADYDKQKALDDLENEKEIAVEATKTKSQRKISIAIGIVLLLISLLAFVIFNRLKVTRQQKSIIEEQKKKVEQSEKYKEQFLANMSHEIRTPMHAISGMTKILKRNAHPPTQDAYLNAMHTSSDNLVVILNDVLDLSKIEAGKLEIESIPMNPRSVIENVLQILKFKAEEKGLKLSYKATNNVPALVMGDPTRLNQILINLVGNAIKFTEKGTVDISLQVENEQLQFQIKDTGMGIPKNKQEHIFGAFEQAKNSTTRMYGGTGLGLSISKQLVELQKGNIWLESKEGEGSSFYVALPLHVAEEDAIGTDLISEEKLKAMTSSLEGIRVLIAEDNPFNQMIAQDDLSYYINGIYIKTVENGAMAVEQFNTTPYDLILMDVQMPEMNGFEATKKIREIEKQEGRTATIPIIAMTASLLKTEIDNCLKAGMNNYIPKPYKLEELIGPIFVELRS